jgi:thioredoxin reductase (NADPH)
MENIIIVGSGPAGLTAAIYSARAALNPLLIEGPQPGGQLTTTSTIENWPGFEHGIDGQKLMDEMKKQASQVGTRFNRGLVSKIEKSGETFNLTLSDQSVLQAKAVIISTGASAITLPLPDKDKLMGYGLSTCAVCDGFFYRNKNVAVIGGGDSAMEEALYLSKIASTVYLIHRRDSFRASKVMQDKVMKNEKIKIVWNSSVVDTTRDAKGLTGVVLENHALSSKETIAVDGLFMAIGHKPNTDFLKGFVDLDDTGYILTNKGTHTSVRGLFAAGDVEDKVYRQAITSSGRGCQAALQAEKFLEGLD